MGPLAAAGVGLAASLITTGGQALVTGKLNKKNREWQEEQEQKRRDWAKQDWDTTNAYNSPTQMMQRYKEAGLNPYLIYGQSNEGPSINSAAPGNYQGKDIDVGEGIRTGIRTYQDIQLQQEQIKNLQIQRQNMVLDGALKTLTATKLSQDTTQQAKLNPIALDTAAQNLLAMQADHAIKINKEHQEQKLRPGVIEAQMLDIQRMKAENEGKEFSAEKAKQELENLKKDGTLKDLEIALKQKGMSWNDPLWLRALAQLYPGENLTGAVKKLLVDLKKGTADVIKSMNPF